MPRDENSIQKRLVKLVLLISGGVLLLSSTTILVYEFLNFRQTTINQASTLAKIIATNSTAALAFDNADDAREVLSAFRAESHVVAAGLYTRSGRLFASYTADGAAMLPAALAEQDGYRFEQGHLIGVQPVVQGSRRMGTLYLKSNMGAIYERFRSFSVIVALVLALACAVA